MLQFAVCDDEPQMAQEIAALLATYLKEHRAEPYAIRQFRDGAALLASGFAPDLAFLDIRMPGMDGLETARQLRQHGSRALIVFVTVLGECVFDAFEVQAFDFLLKPPDPSRFRRMMARAMAALGPGDSLVVQRGNACRVVGFSELAYCEVQGRKIFLHLCDGSLVDYYGRMDALEKRLDSRFFRCHRSYLVNLDCVRGCGDGQAALAQGGSVPVSRLREGDFSRALLRRMRERGH